MRKINKMFCHQFVRLFHPTHSLMLNAEKNVLAALRKKTGYTFINCKKALELHNNDIDLAEKWLHEQAQSMGWSKATKLAERTTSQGLIGVLIRGNVGAMVEVNCETDFVARNEQFRNFVDHVSRVCAQYTELTQFDGDLWKSGFESEAIRNLRLADGKSLGDSLALLIGSVGENAIIKRAICYKVNNDLKLTGYAHPQTITDDPNVIQNVTQLGRYGSILAYRGCDMEDELPKNLCQHIIGYNPQKLGEANKDEPHENKDDELCLIHQEYLADSNRTVGDVLLENNIDIIDFQRYECGEDINKQVIRTVKYSE